MLFELSHKELKPEDWKKLAGFWGFRQEHIAAIEYQDSGSLSECFFLQGIRVE